MLADFDVADDSESSGYVHASSESEPPFYRILNKGKPLFENQEYLLAALTIQVEQGFRRSHFNLPTEFISHNI